MSDSFITSMILRWIISAIAIISAAYLLSGITVPSIYIALILAFIFGLLNAILRPVLVVLTLPINILTLGLFLFIINGFLFWFPSTFIEGFHIAHFGWAVAGSIVVSIISWVGNNLID